MKHFLILTDINGRQYLFQITEEGLNVQTVSAVVTATVEDPQLFFIMEQIAINEPFIIGATAFNVQNIVAVQLQAYPADEI